MGKLINGVWVAKPEQTRTSAGGDFVRGVTSFRDWVRADGSSRFAPEAGRYHLFVAWNCPWAHRTILARALKGLTEAVGMSVAHFRRNEHGWWYPPSEAVDAFQPDDNGQIPLPHVYAAADGAYTGSATTPVLWDRELETIVSNESAEIIMMLDGEFGPAGANDLDLYPEPLREEIDRVNAWVYSAINNGVYKCGFARTQEAYERAFWPLFEALDRAEERLSRHRFLVGDQLTLADVRLIPTVARFDAVYHGHFKCNRKRIVDYPNLWGYARDLYQTPGVGETFTFELYKKGYMGRSPGINPTGIISKGPELDWDAPHGRG